MTHLSAEFWRILLYGVVLCLWGIVILYLAKNVAKKSQIALMKGSKEKDGSFRDEVLVELVKQQSERAFDTISNTIDKERRVMEGLIRKGEINEEGALPRAKKSNQNQSPSLEMKRKDLGGGSSRGDRYGDVVRLADAGLSMTEISKRLKVPKGEIELLLRLRRKGHGHPKGGPPSVTQ